MNKNEVWNILRNLSSNRSQPWLICSDLNEIMFSFEKKGGVPRDDQRMENFRQVIDDCRLMDKGYSGQWYTWERGNLLETNIREHLDRGLANESWFSLFCCGQIQHFPYSMSDHCPLLLSLDIERNMTRSHQFRFEAWWSLKETFEDNVQRSWASSIGSLFEKLEILKKDLQIWEQLVKVKKHGIKRKLMRQVERLMDQDRNDESLADLIDARIQLNWEVEKDETYWE